MKARTLMAHVELTSDLEQRALKKFIKRALERESWIEVHQVTVQTVQPIKRTEQKFEGEPAYSDDEG